MKDVELAGAVLWSPDAAFAELKERPRFWLPLLAMLLASIGVLLWYYAVVDINWLADYTVSNTPQFARLTDAQRARVLATINRNTLMVSAVVGGTLVLLVMRLVEAGYYSLAGKITNVQLSFKHWFALAWWSSIPQLLGVAAMAAFLLLYSNRQISSDELQLLSLNQLFFHRKMGEPGFALLSNLSLLHPWAWAVTVIGVRKFSGRSWGFSSAFALLPLLVMYGVFAFFSFR